MGLLLGRTICNPSVDTKEIQAFEKPMITPNPANHFIAVTFSDVLPFDFQIASMEGKLMKKGVSTKEIKVSDLPNGVFILKIQKQGVVFSEKIVVEK